MKLLIDIPEEAYKLLQTDGVDWLGAEHILNAVCNGIPLPEYYGDLIDRSKIEYLKVLHDLKYGHISWSDAGKLIKNSAPTIIPATKEKSCKNCKYGKAYEYGADITTMDDECGGCCSWNDKWTPKTDRNERR